jgi:hypothetical protein
MDQLLNYLYGAVVVPVASESDRRSAAADLEAAHPRASGHASVVQAALQTAMSGGANLTSEDLDMVYGAVWGLIGGIWAAMVDDVRTSRAAVWAQGLVPRAAARSARARGQGHEPTFGR